MSRTLPTLFLLLIPLPLSAAGDSDQWPQWRGTHFSGAARSESFRLDRDQGLAIAWRQQLGSGYSSISVANGRAITMFSDGSHDYLIALDAANGQELWRHRIDETYRGHTGSHDGTLSTPAIDDDLVFGVGPRGQILALAVADGSTVWESSMERLGSREPDFGWTTSPLIAGNVLVLQTGAGKGKTVTGFDRRTGKVMWTAADDTILYQSPSLLDIHGETHLVCAGDQTIFGLDPGTGEQLWHFRHEGGQGMNHTPAGRNRIFLHHAWQQGMLLEIQRQDEGDERFTVAEIWRSRGIRGTNGPPVYHDGHLYGYAGPILTCVDASTGKTVWRSRQPGDGFVMLVNDSLIVLTKEGVLTAAEATPAGYREVASVQLFDHLGWNPPSFADGRIYARNLREIACVVPATTATSEKARLATSAEAGKLPGSRFAAFVAKVEAAAEGDRAALIDEFLASQERFPIIEDERLVHVVYRGEVQDLAIGGDHLQSYQTLPCHRVAGTDLSYFSFALDPDALVSYYLLKDFDEQIADPRNPDSIPSLDGSRPAPRSLVIMPRWSDSDHLAEQQRLVSFEHQSAILENTRQISVYLPSGYDESDERYPVLYVHYGALAAEHGQLPRSLDNLIGRSVQPIIAVFVHLNEEAGFQEISPDNQDAYVQMVVEEIVPAIDGRYRTITEPESRAVMGASAAGFIAAYSAFTHPGVFGWVAGQSTNVDWERGEQLAELVAGSSPQQVRTRFFLHWGRYDLRDDQQDIDRARDNRELFEQLQAKGYQVDGGERPHAWGWFSWRTVNDEILETIFPLASTAGKL